MCLYTEDFYQRRRERTLRSAREVVPLVLDLLHPRSVVDVGCADGGWLSVFRAHGVEDIYGIDGEWVDRGTLAIPDDRFAYVDLRKPFRLERQFDLVVSLEVAEHLPGECAETFVDCLTRLGPTILFSAAIPWQGGTGHLNEQWPEYWARHFEDRGYVVVDCLRRKIWQNDKVEWPYVQNALMVVRREALAGHPTLQREFENAGPATLSVVHPRKYLEAIGEWRRLLVTVQEIVGLVPPEESVIVVDHEVFRRELVGRRAVPFLERDVEYWGPPADDATGIR